MRRDRWLGFLGSGCLGFVLGAGTVWKLREPLAPVPAPAVLTRVAHAPASPTIGERRASVSAAPAPRKSSDSSVGASLDELRTQALSDRAVLRRLIESYEGATELDTKGTLQALLASMRTPEVLELSLRLAASANPAQRRDGFDLLQAFTAETPAARQQIELTLQTEQDPAVLSSAVLALGAPVVGPEENARVVEHLRRLTEHADPGVRGHSLSQLAQWNRSPNVEAQLYKALADEAQSVREIATLAIAEAGVRTDRLRNALLGIVDDDAESPAVRTSALQALGRFPLNADEYARYLAARTEAGLFGEDSGRNEEQ